MPVLAGTLVAACYGCDQNKGVVQQEISIDMQLSLLSSCRNVFPSLQSNSNVDNSIKDNSSENNQLGPEFKKPQIESSLRSSRYNARSTKVCLGKAGSLGNSIRNGKMRNQRDGKSIKASEEMALKQNLLASETSTAMLYCRFPSSFIDRAEQFFSAGIPKLGDEAWVQQRYNTTQFRQTSALLLTFDISIWNYYTEVSTETARGRCSILPLSLKHHWPRRAFSEIARDMW